MHLREKHGVDITSLSYIPGGKIDKYLGYLNFFFIRETNSIREVYIFKLIFVLLYLSVDYYREEV